MGTCRNLSRAFPEDAGANFSSTTPVSRASSRFSLKILPGFPFEPSQAYSQIRSFRGFSPQGVLSKVVARVTRRAFAHGRGGCQKVSPGTTRRPREEQGGSEEMAAEERRRSLMHKRGTRCHLGESHREEEAPLLYRVPLPPSGRLSK